jgi:uncharacterized membrane protein YphA (DoxX/SURF4 family)
MNTWTRIGLIVLRVVIGWHFLFEGIEKLETTWNHQGPLLCPTAEGFVLTHVFGESKELSDPKAAWSAEGYLREAQGPLAPWFRKQAGDLDADALARLTWEEGSTEKVPDNLPPALDAEWKDKIEKFKAHYRVGTDKAVQPEFIGTLAFTPISPFPAAVPWAPVGKEAQPDSLMRGTYEKGVHMARGDPPASGDKLQEILIDDDFLLARRQTLDWLLHGSRQVPSKLAGVTEKVRETTTERIGLYKKRINELHDIEKQGMSAFEQDVWKDNYRALKKEIAIMRTDLLRDLDKPFNDTVSVARFRLSKAQREAGPLPPEPAGSRQLAWINFITRWGVTLVGVGLLMGLFTRTSCVVGAAFLLMFYLAMPALPWLPVNPRSEGHYLFINKNLIEMIALLTLATTRSGKWFGLDGLVQFLNPFRWRRRAASRIRPLPTSRGAKPQAAI